MTPIRSAGRRAVPRRFQVVILVVLALTAAACSAIPLSGVGGTLVVVETRGGHCLNPPCGSRIAMDADGRVHQLAPEPADLGKIPADVLGTLSAAVRATDFATIKSKPFTGECPVNFDGQELIYEITLAGGTETLASCTVEIDPDLPFVVAIDAALAAAR